MFSGAMISVPDDQMKYQMVTMVDDLDDLSQNVALEQLRALGWTRTAVMQEPVFALEIALGLHCRAVRVASTTDPTKILCHVTVLGR